MLKQWQVDLMKEDEDIAVDEMREAAPYMKAAVKLMGEAIYKLMDAQSILQDYPMGDVVGSLEESLVDLENAIRDLAEKYAEGRRY